MRIHVSIPSLGILLAGWSMALPLLRAGDSAREKGVAEPTLTAAQRSFWAFQAPLRPALPSVKDEGWIHTPVDSFILAKLEQAGLVPAPPADRASLIRRVTFDLTGLPPQPEEVDAFLEDKRPDAYARLVERLLASPHYGERWAQHWLDVVRYAESNGYEADGDRPHAWRYRDYVIGAFNEDMPYDRFIVEQLAGDKLASGQDPRARSDLLVAAGFNRCGPVHIVGGNTDPEVNRQEVLTEMTGTVGSALLGLTIGCARCHDHKFDPISQADYYRLQAFFAAARPTDVDISTAQERAANDKRVKELQNQLAPLRKKVTDLDEPYKTLLTQLKKASLEPRYLQALEVAPAKRTPQQKQLAEQAQVLIKVTWDEILEALSPEERARRALWRAQIHELEARLPPPPAQAWTLQDDLAPIQTYILKRGDPKRKGPPVQPAVPRVLIGGNQRPEASLVPSSVAPNPSPLAPRLHLAHWLTRPDHPLTARVLVNRLWQHHFGRGIVGTPNDFGSRGDRPTHPELLDWLACELVSHGWSIKHLHRLMVLSSAYQQASSVAPERGASGLPSAARIDPDNRWLWRMNRRRLEAEALRDTILGVSGRLNCKVGGLMVRVPLEPEVYDLIFTEGEPDGLWHETPDRREHTRRSIYLFAKRNLPLPLLEAFDRPDTLTSCPVRPVSTFAPQALMLLNGRFVQQRSQCMAARLFQACGVDTARQIQLAYQLALGRLPREAEQHMAQEFLAGQSRLLRRRLQSSRQPEVSADLPAEADPAAAAALADFCLALFNRNEFLYVN
jgi:hypothetical protein